VESQRRHSGEWRRGILHFSIVLLFVLVFVAILGALIYALHRVALLEKRLYSYLFLSVFAAFVVFLLVRNVRKGNVTRIARKIAKFFLGLGLACAAVAAVALYAALVIRRPMVAAACLPPLAGVIYFLSAVVHLPSRINNLFHKI